MKVALVHDYLKEFGGGERVLLALHELYPEAPVYTSYLNERLKIENEKLRNLDIRTSSLQKVPFIKRFSKQFTFFYPLVFESFDFRRYDLVISSSAIWAKGVLTKPKTLHIGYIHTPPRFLYHYPREINRRTVKVLSPILSPLDNYLRIWDYNAAQRPDHLVANSQAVAARIRKFYRRDCTVIYPPVNVQKFKEVESGSGFYFLIVSRLSKYKNIDLAVQACNELNLRLKVVGKGREERSLKKLAGSTVELLGFVNEEQLIYLYTNCRALIYPASDEDFGIAAVEAMAAGKPVIALRGGGVSESVMIGKTGVFFDRAERDSLIAVLKEFEPAKYDKEDCVRQAEKFSKSRFLREFRELVERKQKEQSSKTKNQN